jgi:hypothetical protein
MHEENWRGFKFNKLFEFTFSIRPLISSEEKLMSREPLKFNSIRPLISSEEKLMSREPLKFNSIRPLISSEEKLMSREPLKLDSEMKA